MSPGGGGNNDPLVDETRRQIATIVREIADAAGSDQSTDEFLSLLVDRVLRAMAAEGVIVWRTGNLDHQGLAEYSCVKRLGRMTDQSIPDRSHATHQQVLLEVGRNRQPVVVPPTPGATDPESPANPLEVAVAVVPIDCEPTVELAEYVLEVCLEPDCGLTTQRGYLRFVAQMADLAGEFLRSDHLRRLRRMRELASKVDAAIDRIHSAEDTKTHAALTVDAAAELFGFDRVGLCTLGPKPALRAVSHVNTIETRSPAARQLCQAANHRLDADGCGWIEDGSDSAPGAPLNDSLALRAVVGSDQLRLVCMQVVDVEPIAEELRADLIRLMRHAELAYRKLTRRAAVPGQRFFAALLPTSARPRDAWRSRLMIGAVAAVILTLVACFPVPLVVYSPALIRPADVQTVTASRDAMVDQIHVRHGQRVSAGDTLLTLADPELEERTTSLIGRRAVLVQQQSHWTEVLVDTATHRLERMEQVQGERRLVTEEIQSINDQLAVLERVRDSLTVRADRNGTVDAWRIEQRLQSRPMRRGDLLLRVIASDSDWLADVQVPQSRIAHLQKAQAAQQLSTKVLLEANPQHSLDAQLLQVGPSMPADTGDVPSTAVLLRLQGQLTGTDGSQPPPAGASGAPARVMFRCGKTPIAYLLFQDVIRSTQSNLSLYLASSTTRDTGTNR